MPSAPGPQLPAAPLALLCQLFLLLCPWFAASSRLRRPPCPSSPPPQSPEPFSCWGQGGGGWGSPRTGSREGEPRDTPWVESDLGQVPGAWAGQGEVPGQGATWGSILGKRGGGQETPSHLWPRQADPLPDGFCEPRKHSRVLLPGVSHAQPCGTHRPSSASPCRTQWEGRDPSSAGTLLSSL